MSNDDSGPHNLPCYFDPDEERLWRGGEELPLTLKTLTMLRYLLAHPQRLLSKDVLLDNVWPDTYVNDGEVRHYIAELRGLLDDDAQNPRFIETVHGRGYRFIGEIHLRSPPPPDPPVAKLSSVFSTVPIYAANPSALPAREAELTQLGQWLAQAHAGQRQLGFITGEPGIGKTTLIQTFLATLEKAHDYWIGHGQCVENQDTEEAYTPVVDALQHLCHGPGGEQVHATLNRYAPSWLLQIPELLDAKSIDMDDLQRRAQDNSRTRMLRELSHALAALSRQRCLILWLKDLHWADAASLDLLRYLARGIEPSSLLVLCSYRPMDVADSASTLRSLHADLQLGRLCRDINLAPFSEVDIAAFLEQYLPGLPTSLAPLLHQHSGGNPLFLANMLDHLNANNSIVNTSQGWQLQQTLAEIELGLPDSLRYLIEQRLARLNAADQQLLEVASVAGVSFSAAVIAARLQVPIEAIEKRCNALVQQQQFLRRAGTSDWPDGSLAAHYDFIHTLYQTTLYQRLTPARCASIHHTIAVRLEQAYAEQSNTVAAELAFHFEQGRDYDRAVTYLHQVGQIDFRRHANQTATRHFRKALQLLDSLPSSAAQQRRALELQLNLATALFGDEGFAGSAVIKAYAQAHYLCHQLSDNTHLVTVLAGQRTFHFVRMELDAAEDRANELLALAQQHDQPRLWLHAHRALGTNALYRGDLHQAHSHLEQGSKLYQAKLLNRHELDRYGSPHASCLIHSAHAWWLLGKPEQALAQAEQALHIARELGHPYCLGPTLVYFARLQQLLRDPNATLGHAESVITLAAEFELPFQGAWAAILRAWALAELDPEQTEPRLRLMQESVAAYQVSHVKLAVPELLALVAQLQARSGRPEQGLATLAEAHKLSQTCGAHYYLAELYRLQGELQLQHQPNAIAEAERWFRNALTTSQAQSALAWQLRAATSLARLWQRQGKTQQSQVYSVLAPVLKECSEGFDSPDRQEAKQVLALCQ